MGVDVLEFLQSYMQLARKVKEGLLVGFFVSSLTFWKTVLFTLRYTAFCNGSHHLGDANWDNLFLFILLPSALWIGCPLLLVCFYGTLLKSMLMGGRKGKMN